MWCKALRSPSWGPESVRERERDNRTRQDRVERASAALYERLGTNVVLACLVGGILVGIATGAVIVVVAFRYLRLSSSQALSFYALWMPIFLALLLIGVWTCRRELASALAWRLGHGPTSASEGWHIYVGIPRIVGRVAVIGSLGVPPAVVYAILHYHRPWWDCFALITGAAIALLGVWVVIASASELGCAPMLREIATELPAEFEPHDRGVPLRTRALLPLPIVTYFAAMIVGAFSNISRNPDLRLTFAVGVCFVTVAVATAIFLIVTRSVLAPVDDLIAATARVRHGDISTRVPLTSLDELGQLTISFNEMLAELRRHTDELRASRERIVTTADEERRRMERDLHDGAQQELVLARLKLELLDRAIDEDPASARTTAGELREDLDRALAQLRDLAHGLYPPLLESDGLPGALQEAVGRAAIPTKLDCDGAGRYRPDLEAAVYFCCLEALQNAAKHAGPRARAIVRVAERERGLRFEVADDGHGFDPAGGSSGVGLQNMTDRIGALGGELRIESVPGEGTRVRGEVPVAS